MNATKCRKCGASIVWAVNSKGHRIPLDAEPAADGSLVEVEGIEGSRFVESFSPSFMNLGKVRWNKHREK